MSEQPTQNPDSEVDENDPRARGLWFANVHDFVVSYLTPNYVRRINKEQPLVSGAVAALGGSRPPRCALAQLRSTPGEL